MRHVNVCLQGLENCGMQELCGFPYVDRWSDLSPITDEEWLCALWNTMDPDWDPSDESYFIAEYLPGIVVFSTCNTQEGVATPRAFKEWLRSSGDPDAYIVETIETKNANSGNMIQAWMWIPTQAFREKLEKYNESQSKKKKKNVEEPSKRNLSRFR